MAVLEKSIQEAFDKVGCVAFATVDAEGQPNTNVIGIKRVVADDVVYLSDQFFNKTLANLKVSPKVSIAFWGEGFAYQIHGTARYVDSGEEFLVQKQWADGIFQAMDIPFTAKGGVFVTVDAVYQMSSGPDAGKQLA